MLLGSLNSCLNDDILEDDDAFPIASVDTLAFDTVFTTLGSTTKDFLIYNIHDQQMVVDRIYLAGGTDSQYRINVDGVPGTVHEEVSIGPNDSIYVFVEVTVDPNDEQMPFLLEDSIVIEYNDYSDKVLLEAYGQNAQFFDAVEVCDEVFTDELPIVITRLLYVPAGCSLTIEEGVDIYVRRGASFLVEGNLTINGTADSLVSFQGIRLEPNFDGQPGQWRGLDLLRGSNSEIKHAVIQGSDVGVSLGSLLAPESTSDFNWENRAQMKMENCVIKYQLGSGVFSFLSEIELVNTLIHTCGGNVLNVSYGGVATATNCSFINYGGAVNHQNEIISLANALQWETGGAIFSAEADVLLKNTLIMGSLENEIAIQDSVPDVALLNYQFDHCLIKTTLEDNEFYNNCIFNPQSQDTLFVDRFNEDFHLNDDSPAIDAGTVEGNVPTIDLEAKPRDGMPDIGCYEF